MFDQAAYIYPADNSKAIKHRLATRIFKGTLKEIQQGDRCQCCHRHVGVEDNDAPVSWDYHPAQKLSFLGSGVPLLFYFTQNAEIFLVFLFVVFGVYSMISNWYGNSCDCGDSILGQITKYSVINKLKDSKELSIQTGLCAVFMIIYLFFNQWLVLRIRKKNIICDQVINSPSDYSLIITNLPKNTTEDQIQQLVREHCSKVNQQQLQRTNNLQIQTVIMSYGLKKLLKLSQKNLKKYFKKKKKQPSTPIPREKIKVDLKNASFAIVVFRYRLSKELFLQYKDAHKSFGKGIFHSCFYPSLEFSIRGHSLGVYRAPQPDDIIWENADVSQAKMTFNVFISYLIGISLLFGGGYLQYFLQVIENQITNKTYNQLFSLMKSVAMTIVNMILLQFLRIITKLQGQKTRTSQNRSLLIKICLYSFFNCGVFSSAAYIIATSLSKFTLDGQFTNQIFYFMVINAVLPNVLNLITYKFQLPNFIFRKLKEKSPKTQRAANQLYELGQPDFPVQYGYVIQTIWLTCFYSPLVPLSACYSFFGLLFFYYTQAQLFRTSYRHPNMLSFDLTRMACRLIDYSGLLLSLGHLLILLYIKYTVKVQLTTIQIVSLVVSLIFSFVLIFTPSFKINRAYFKLPHKYDDNKEYKECSNHFQVTYQQTSPLFDQAHKKRRHLINYANFQKFYQEQKQKNGQNELQTRRERSFLQNDTQSNTKKYNEKGIDNQDL